MEKCTICGKEFTAAAALAQHLKDKHGKTSAESTQEKESVPQSQVRRQKPSSRRKRNRHPVAIGILAVAVVAGLGIYFVAAPVFAPPPFPYITSEGFIHVHPYLQIWIEGNNVTIPDAVGVREPNFEPVHTHDASGILHIELSKSDSAAHNYTLADFFTIWRWTSSTVMFNGTARPVVFNQTDILGFRADATHRVILLVDGATSTAWGSLNLERLDYCDTSNSNSSPCSPTAGGSPLWQAAFNYPYGTGHKIVIEYVST